MSDSSLSEATRQVKSESGWREVDGGLLLVVLGYFTWLVAAAAALAFGPLAGGVSLWAPPDAPSREREDVLMLCAVALVGGGILSYVLVLLGQWRCLVYAPSRLNIKEMLYVCLVVLLLASGMFVAAVHVEDGAAVRVMQESLGDLRKLDFSSLGGLLLLTGSTLGLVNFFVYNHCLRVIGNGLSGRVRRVDVFLVGMSLLLGGTVGSLVYFNHLTFKAQVLTGLAAGWGVCFVWHLVRLSAVRRLIVGALARLGSEDVGARIDLSEIPAVLSGVRRSLRALEQ
jgi:hypothetical protein